MNDYAIEMEGISKDFGPVRALYDVTLRARRGHIHALVGENGAGKSTLMKILDGVYPTGSYRGKLRVDGQRVELRSPHDAKRKRIGYVPQEISVIEPLSVAENIFVGHFGRGRVWWVSRRELNSRARQFLRERHIDLDPDMPVAYLAASQRQLVMIARALAVDPSVLILDEATACLTERETGFLFELVLRLRAQGLTCIFVSHKLREVEELADDLTVLRDGAVVAEFERGRFSRQDVVLAMVGRRLDNLAPTRDPPADTDEALRVEQLTAPHPRLAGRNVVENVSFSVRRGEILGLAGLVGSGRSDVLNAIYGRLPHRGRLFVKGCSRRIRTPRQAHRAGIGLLTEDRKQDGLLFNLAVRENITIGSLGSVSCRGIMDRRAETRHAEELVRQLSIRAPAVTTPVTALSGGNQQKVILARLLLAKPRILLLDEPTKGVDVAAKAEIYQILFRLVREGMAIILVSSELTELMSLCDRILVLSRGRVADEMRREAASEGRIMLAATGAFPDAVETLAAPVR
jgi:ABC-type sugar transport system ATPase subunit